MDLAGFEPAIFGLEVRRHIQAWLQVLFNFIYNNKYKIVFKFFVWRHFNKYLSFIFKFVKI